jgi:hypothetical protein
VLSVVVGEKKPAPKTSTEELYSKSARLPVSRFFVIIGLLGSRLVAHALPLPLSLSLSLLDQNEAQVAEKNLPAHAGEQRPPTLFFLPLEGKSFFCSHPLFTTSESATMATMLGNITPVLPQPFQQHRLSAVSEESFSQARASTLEEDTAHVRSDGTQVTLPATATHQSFSIHPPHSRYSVLVLVCIALCLASELVAACIHERCIDLVAIWLEVTAIACYILIYVVLIHNPLRILGLPAAVHTLFCVATVCWTLGVALQPLGHELALALVLFVQDERILWTACVPIYALAWMAFLIARSLAHGWMTSTGTILVFFLAALVLQLYHQHRRTSSTAVVHDAARSIGTTPRATVLHARLSAAAPLPAHSGGGGGGNASSDTGIRSLRSRRAILQMDLTSPFEQAMRLLNEMKHNSQQDERVHRVIDCLNASAHSSNLFRPKMEQILAQKHQQLAGALPTTAASRHARSTSHSFGAHEVIDLIPPEHRLTIFVENGSADEKVAQDAAAADAAAASVQSPLDADTLKWLSGLVQDEDFHGGEDSDEEQEIGDTSSSGHGSISPTTALTRRSSSKGSRTSFGGAGSGGVITMVPNLLSSDEDQTIATLGEQLNNWDFDIFDVEALTKGRPLFFIGLMLFRKHNLIQTFRIDKVVLCTFLTNVEKGYKNDLPYHTSTHGADVARSMHFFLQRIEVNDTLPHVDVLVALVASLLHDYQHPGTNNDFMTKTNHELAITYNYRSVLENMHASTGWRMLQRPENNILANLKPTMLEQARKMIVDLILVTDLSQHFEFVTHFRSTMMGEAGKTANHASELYRGMLLKMALKCSDIAHAAKNVTLHIKWSERITQEFYEQGRQEKKLGLHVSPFMDADNPGVSKAQLGFLDFLATPLFSAWSEFLNLPEDNMPCMRELARNRKHWTQQPVLPPLVAPTAPAP